MTFRKVFFRWEKSPNGRWCSAVYYDEKPTKMYGEGPKCSDWFLVPLEEPFIVAEHLNMQVIEEAFPRPQEV